MRTSWLDNKHVVFRQVLEGMKVLRTLESQETRAFDVSKKAYACDLGLACGHKLRKDPQERKNIDEFKMPYFLASSFRILASSSLLGGYLGKLDGLAGSGSVMKN
ncbi:hypothetical protein Bca52824_080043 [Brassica carinata]|uniref:PPIase cyclophilin-type domain-containing protein n=1 Tax=Brassica carinata TaxID=52824 RepID=A0A8X7PYK3_BRACI|nr:hypothetical protein Bca52824_080043 [Brassica carinata]